MSDDTAEVIRRLGGRPCRVLHYLYCDDGSTAARLAQRLHRWIVSVFPPDDEVTRWCVHGGQIDVILTEGVVVAFSRPGPGSGCRVWCRVWRLEVRANLFAVDGLSRSFRRGSKRRGGPMNCA